MERLIERVNTGGLSIEKSQRMVNQRWPSLQMLACQLSSQRCLQQRLSTAATAELPGSDNMAADGVHGTIFIRHCHLTCPEENHQRIWIFLRAKNC